MMPLRLLCPTQAAHHQDAKVHQRLPVDPIPGGVCETGVCHTVKSN